MIWQSQKLEKIEDIYLYLDEFMHNVASMSCLGQTFIDETFDDLQNLLLSNVDPKQSTPYLILIGNMMRYFEIPLEDRPFVDEVIKRDQTGITFWTVAGFWKIFLSKALQQQLNEWTTKLRSHHNGEAIVQSFLQPLYGDDTGMISMVNAQWEQLSNPRRMDLELLNKHQKRLLLSYNFLHDILLETNIHEEIQRWRKNHEGRIDVVLRKMPSQFLMDELQSMDKGIVRTTQYID